MNMKKLIIILFGLMAFVNPLVAQNRYGNYSYAAASNSSENASMTFSNQSDYTMVLKVIYARGGLYSTVTVYPHSNSTMYFSKSNTFRLKIKAISGMGRVSYHNGGSFSVTCNSYEYSSDVMTFKMSTYGTGLGPSISSKDFESNY